VPDFDAFIAIDWSGAARAYDGIAVAMCRAGRGAPKLVAPRATRWTRQGTAGWLKRILGSGQRLLIGFDFAFGFPFEEHGYFGGHTPGIDDIFSLWDFIDSKSADDDDFGCTTFISDSTLQHLFWKSGPKPPQWVERKRIAEHACAQATKTRPDTLYKLLHSKQVGKASITGMRVLNHLRSSKAARLSVWPFQPPTGSVIVEIYPTMFRKLSTGSIAKIRSRRHLNLALAPLNSLPMPGKTIDRLSDHETDALISAAGLRSIAHNADVWSRPELTSPRVRREGWIFGV